MMKNSVLSAIGIVLIASLASCNKDAGKSTLNVRLTDNPGPFSAVNIDLQGIEITGDSSKTTMLEVTPAVINLLDWANGADTLIGTGLLEPGKVEQIRLILGPNSNLVLDGVTYPLSTPSAEQTGLKLQVHQVFEAGVEYALVLDFDARHSIIETGNGNYKLKPVLRIIDSAISGAIKGQISPAGTLANVEAYSGTKTWSTGVDAQGYFLFKGMPAGTYAITIFHALPSGQKDLSGIEVELGKTNNLGIIEL